ncbi:hypothetical protein CR156_17250 [Stenotrophomonas lactitubi]|uniref:hypothetical protein n=1 Tax=Stenotrophomonas lactitubi TaxID=2045214 RepID=UPI000C27ACEC|nr:hypothetical protein [Stenotrophomonas lactitubi]PJO53791.1 hypothetical protein CR156_17250 [Stenotrophomonas lactitubi]
MTTDKTPATLAVDVLAVMDQAIEREKDAGQAYVAQVAARAAVAELIEAAQAVENSCVRHDANDANLFRRLDAALARVKGESA